MARLGIFTVKSLHVHNGAYYTYGGFGRYLQAIRPYFEHTVLVAHVRRAPPRQGDYSIPSAGLTVVHLPPIKNELEALLSLPVQFWRCWRTVPLFDIAHVRMPDYTGVVGGVVCLIRKKPFFCQIIDDWYLLGQRTSWRRKFGLGLGLKLHYRLYDFCERMVSRGQMVFAQGRTCYTKHRCADAELVLSSSHSTEDIVAPKPRFQRRPWMILNVARLLDVKNQQLLIEVLARLNLQSDQWRLRLVGEGPNRSKLEELAARLGVRRHVEFTGKIEHGSTLWQQFDDADVFVLSSRSEGTPKVVLEAMARAVPVVATAVSGVPDMVLDGQRGLLVQDNDIDAMCAALCEMRNNAVLRERCVSNALQFARENTVEHQVRSMLDKVSRRWTNLFPPTSGERDSIE